MVHTVPDVSVEDERGESSRLPPLNFQTKLTLIAQSWSSRDASLGFLQLFREGA